MATPSLIIFDFDGVLVNTEELTLRIELDFVRNTLGRTIDTQDYIGKFTGMAEDKWITEVQQLPAHGHPRGIDPAQLISFKARVTEAVEEKIAIIPGAEAFLDKLKKPVAVASNSSKQHLSFGLKKTGLDRFFNGNVFSAESVPSGKPEPDLFLYAADQMGFQPEICLVIEDSANGVLAAKKAGMSVIGFTGGGHCPPLHSETLLKCGADTILSSFDETLDEIFFRESK